MTKKPLIALLAAVGILLSAMQSHAGTFTAFGPKVFARGNGKPVAETASFNIKNPNTAYTLKIYNGGINFEYSKVSSAIIKLNGATIFDTSDFNQQVSQLQKQVAVANSNILSVELRSSPGSGLTVLIEGEDGTPPSVVINSPANGTYLDDPSVTINGTASDAISWVNTVSVNGTTAQLSGESYTSTVQLTEGPNTITATAIDAAGNTGSAAVSVILDTIPPKITLDPVPSLTNKPQLTITGKVEDASPITSLTVNGIPAILANNTFTAAINLIEGNNNIVVTATDKAENTSVSSVAVTIDTVPPAIAITSPSNGSTVSTDTVTVAGTIDGSAIVTINGMNAIIVNNTFTVSGIRLTDGGNSITVTAVDAAGNQGTATVTLSRGDITPPAITMTSPQNGTYIGLKELFADNYNLKIEGTAYDASYRYTTGMQCFAPPGLFEMPNATWILDQLPINGNPVPQYFTNPYCIRREPDKMAFGFTMSRNYINPMTGWREGANTITVRARDRAGNISAVNLTIYLDTTAPSVTVDSIREGQFLTASTITVSGTVSDNAATVTVNGIMLPVTNNAYVLPGYTLQTGANTINIIAADPAGNSSSRTITFYKDYLPPSINITSPKNGDKINKDAITVTGTIRNNAAGITVNGVAAVISNDTFSAIIPLQDGTNIIKAIAVNPAGSDTKTIEVTFDNQAPTVTSITPAFNATEVPLDSTITVIFSEAMTPSSISGTTFRLSSEKGAISGAVTYTGNTAAFIPSTPLRPSTVYTVTIEGGMENTSGVRDLAGNSLATDYVWVFKTLSLPLEITIDEPQDGVTINKTNAIIKGTIKAQTPDVGISVNGIVAEVNGRHWAAKVPLQVGQNNMEVTAIDSTGNIDQKQVTINVQTTEQMGTINVAPQSGTAPLYTTFDMAAKVSYTINTWYADYDGDGIATLQTTRSVDEIESYKIDYEGDGVIDMDVRSNYGITHIYETPGIYFPTVTMRNIRGNTYTDSTIVNVLSKEEMDTLLKGKWEGMKGAMGSGDSATALDFFTSSSKAKYSAIFTALKDYLPSIAANMRDINLVSITGDVVEYRISRTEVIDGQSMKITYFIYFTKDGDGLWKIESF